MNEELQETKGAEEQIPDDATGSEVGGIEDSGKREGGDLGGQVLEGTNETENEELQETAGPEEQIPADGTDGEDGGTENLGKKEAGDLGGQVLEGTNETANEDIQETAGPVEQKRAGNEVGGIEDSGKKEAGDLGVQALEVTNETGNEDTRETAAPVEQNPTDATNSEVGGIEDLGKQETGNLVGQVLEGTNETGNEDPQETAAPVEQNPIDASNSKVGQTLEGGNETANEDLQEIAGPVGQNPVDATSGELGGIEGVGKKETGDLGGQALEGTNEAGNEDPQETEGPVEQNPIDATASEVGGIEDSGKREAGDLGGHVLESRNETGNEDPQEIVGPVEQNPVDATDGGEAKHGDLAVEEVGVVHGESAAAAGSSMDIDVKISIPDAESKDAGAEKVLILENGLNGAENLKQAEDQVLKLEAMDVDSKCGIAVCPELDSSAEGTEVNNDSEITCTESKTSNSEVRTTVDMDGKVACLDVNQDKAAQTIGCTGESDAILADPECVDDRACVAERSEFAAEDMDFTFSMEDEVPESIGLDDSCSGKDQPLMVKTPEIVGGSSVDDADHATVTACEIVLESKVEPVDADACGLMENRKESTSTVTRESVVEQAITLSADEQIESSAVHCGGKNAEIPGEYENLKVEAKHGIVVESNVVDNTSAKVDPSLVRDHNANLDILEESTSLKDEKQELDVRPSETFPDEVDGHQDIPSNVNESMNEVAVAVAFSEPVAEVTTGSQAACSSAPSHDNGDPVYSCVTDFISPLPEENQDVEAHVVSNGTSLPDEDQTMCTNVSDVVMSHEVVDRAIEAKDTTNEADENLNIHSHVTELKNAELSNGISSVDSPVVDVDTCTEKIGIVNSQGEAVEENVSLPDDFCGTREEGNLELHLSESLNGNVTGDLSGFESSGGQEAQVEEPNVDTEQVHGGGEEMQIGEQAIDAENMERFDEQITEETAITTPESFARVHLASSFLPSENEDEYRVSDLVWGKVRSHPWWPGQIFDPADASEKAIKHLKKDSFLVAYFGDRTFAWNEAHLLKPFWTHFSEVENQSHSETFHNAVSCALEEVSRRVELGMACSCIPKDAYDMIEYQTVENTGIRPESSKRYGMDESMGVSSFEPKNLLDYILTVAQSPSGGVDQLELVIAKAQLLAISRQKGVSRLPEFQLCGGSLENEADTSELSEVVDRTTPVGEDEKQLIAGKGKLKTENSSSRKRKHNLKDGVYPLKKEKSLSEVMDDGPSSPDAEDESDEKAASKSVSLSSGKKRKAVDSLPDGSEVQNRRISFYAAKVSKTASPLPKPSFKIGECIRRVASQLTGTPSILKCSSPKSQKVDGNGDNTAGDSLDAEYSSLDEMLSQLHLAAWDPLKGYSFLSNLIPFFSSFRNSIILRQHSGRQNASAGRQGGGRKRKASHAIIGSAEDFEFDDVNDSYWTDMVVQNSEEDPSGNNHIEGGYQLVAVDPDKVIKPRRKYTKRRYSYGDQPLAAEEPAAITEEKKRDPSPTELILHFTEGDSVPSEVNLNKIFRRFGPLKESETEVDRLTSRARVIFKKCCDAEVAFSSAGKFNIFGPMLVSYQLSYTPSIGFGTLPLETSELEENGFGNLTLELSQVEEDAT